MRRVLPARLLPWLAVALVATFGLLAMLTVGRNATDGDVLSYERGVRAILAGTSPYAPHQADGPYRLGSISWGRGFAYPPTSLAVLWPTALGLVGPLKALNAVALLSVVALIAWRQTHRPLAVGAAIAVTMVHPGMLVREGQIEPLLAAATGALWLWPSGWLAFAGGAVKVYPLAGLVWVARKRGPILLPLLATTLLVAAWIVLWPQLWGDWLSATLNLRADCNAIGWFSVTCATGTRWIGPALAAVLLIGTWRVRSDELAFFLLTLAILVAVPDTYASYWLIPWVGALPLLLTTSVPSPAVLEPAN